MAFTSGGLIDAWRSKDQSVVLTEGGARLAEQLFSAEDAETDGVGYGPSVRV